MIPHTLHIAPSQYGVTITVWQEGHERPLYLDLHTGLPLGDRLAALAPILEEGVAAYLARRDAAILAAPDTPDVPEVDDAELRRLAEEADRT